MGLFAFGWGKRPPTIEAVTDLTVAAESFGFDSVHIPWHMTLASSFDWGNRHNLDPLVILPYLAARTSEIGLALNPWTVSTYHPFHWAQYIATLDYVSGGRAISGLSKLFLADDAQVGNAVMSDADATFDEGLAVIAQLLTPKGSYDGESKTWNMDALALDPKPSRDIPIWISGGDDQAIERAARFGHYLKPVGLTPDEYATRVRPALDRASAPHGRSVKISSSVVVFVRAESDDERWVDEHVMPLVHKRLHGKPMDDGCIVGTPEECARRITALFASGVDHLLLDTFFHGWETEEFGIEQLRRISDLVAPMVEIAE